MSKFGVGIIGCGGMGRSLAHSANTIEYIDVQCVSDLDEERGKSLAEEVDAEYNRDYHELLADDRIQGVLIASPPFVHRPIAVDAANAGKHVFSEKPMAPTFIQGQKNLKLAIKNNLHYVIGNMRRHDDGVQYAKKILKAYIHNNEIGSLISYRSYCYAGGDYCNIDGYIKTTERNLIENNLPIAPSWVDRNDEKKFEKFQNFFVHNINIINFFFETDYIVSKKISKNNGGSIFFDHGNFFGQFDYAYSESDLWEEGIDFHFTHGSIKVTLPPAFLKNQTAKVIIYDGKKNKYIQPYFESCAWTDAITEGHYMITEKSLIPFILGNISIPLGIFYVDYLEKMGYQFVKKIGDVGINESIPQEQSEYIGITNTGGKELTNRLHDTPLSLIIKWNYELFNKINKINDLYSLKDIKDIYIENYDIVKHNKELLKHHASDSSILDKLKK